MSISNTLALATAVVTTIIVILTIPELFNIYKNNTYLKVNKKSNMFHCRGILFKECNLRLATEITSPEDYQRVLQGVDSLKYGDTLTVHLVGDGGSITSAIQLFYSIKYTKAATTLVVEGDIQSAHSLLLFSADKVVINYGTSMMIHNSTGYQAFSLCEKFRGKLDRGQSYYKKCEDSIKSHSDNMDRFMVSSGLSEFLTYEEQEMYINGHNLYFPDYVICKRLKHAECRY